MCELKFWLLLRVWASVQSFGACSEMLVCGYYVQSVGIRSEYGHWFKVLRVVQKS